MRKKFFLCFLLLLYQIIAWTQDSNGVFLEEQVVSEGISSTIAADVYVESSQPIHWLHFIIILVVVAVVVFFQIKRFRDTITKIGVFEDIFALSDLDYFYEREQGDLSSSKLIYSKHYNPVFNRIEDAINNYLTNNRGTASDYHLIKDIVDRNCDAKEEEIYTQIPVPLYLGLVGTMAGILIGIGYLWISGDLSKLLYASGGNSGAYGVEALLGSVALAMISSILGIILTTFGSMKAKDAKTEEEKKKHIFLSWLQANLLPNLTNDTAQTLERMSTNLLNFNKTFSTNTNELGKTLSQVNEATALQKQLMETVEKLADKNISRQNLELYNALKDSSREIATLGIYLQNSNQYLAQVRDLNEKLDKNESRTKAIEDMAKFFKEEIEQIQLRKEAINKAVGEVDSRLEETFRKLTEHSTNNIEAFKQALGIQQDALQKKLSETQVIVDELKNLSSIKDSITKFEKATAEQNLKIEELTKSINFLAESKSGVGRINIKIPTWLKIIAISTMGIVIITCIVFVLIKYFEVIQYHLF